MSTVKSWNSRIQTALMRNQKLRTGQQMQKMLKIPIADKI